MADRIAAMVRQGDPQSIQRYVKSNLPADQASLERIYKELLRYSQKPPSPPKQPQKLQSTQHSHSLRAINQKNTDHSQAAYEKRSNVLMQRLKEKGFKILSNDEETGMKVFQQQKSRMVKPLKTNSKLLQGGQAGIDRLIERFNANCDFYGNNLQDVTIDIGKSVDREMREFLDRRQAALGSFQNFQQLELHRPAKYADIPSKVTRMPPRKLSQREPPPNLSRKTSRMSVQHLKSTQGLMDTCQKQILARKFKQIPITRNDFLSLQKRLSGQNENQWDLGAVVNLDKVREKMSKEQYERYTHSYMKMMTNKTQEGSKCKMNPYAKELLQDERKMRNIIDFSQQ